MMYKRILFVLLMLASFSMGAIGQTDEAPKPVKPKPKEHARFVLKSYYYSQDYYFKANILEDLDYGEIAGIARHANVGFSLKIPIGHVPITGPLVYANHFELSQHVEMFKAHEVYVSGNIDRWVNIDGEGENVGESLHFVNHRQSLKIMKRDMKRKLINATPGDSLKLVKDQIEMTYDQIHPKK